MRNLNSNEIPKAMLAFGDKLKRIQINGKPLATGADLTTIVINPDISIGEIRQATGANDKDILTFVRQLYIRTMSEIIKETFGGDILNIPTVSFTSNDNNIILNY